MQTFTKAERLCGKTALDQLFQTGKSFNSYPFKVIWQETTSGTTPIQVVISVPKRLFKKAVHRNRIKRIVREAYRKNKAAAYASLNNRKVLLLLIYTAKTTMEYKDVEQKTILVLERLNKAVIT